MDEKSNTGPLCATLKRTAILYTKNVEKCACHLRFFIAFAHYVVEDLVAVDAFFVTNPFPGEWP